MTILTPDEISKLLRISVRFVYAHSIELGGVRIGGKWIFTQEGLEACQFLNPKPQTQGPTSLDEFRQKYQLLCRDPKTKPLQIFRMLIDELCLPIQPKTVHEKQIEWELKLALREMKLTDTKPRDFQQSNGNEFIYIIKVRNHCKIGKCRKMKKRIGEYTKLPDEPVVLMCEEVPQDKKVEQLLHGVFASKRIRGEWFVLTLKDIAKAKKIIKNCVVPELK